MGVSLTRVLRAVQNIYRLPGPVTAPQSVDIAPPISLVHDVSREAELGSGIGVFDGYFTMQQVLNHGAAGRQFAGSNPYTTAALFTDLDEDALSVWLIAAGAFASTNAAGSEVMVQQVGVSNPLDFAPFWMLGYWDSKTGLEPDLTLFNFENSGGNPWQQTMPVYIVPNTRTGLAPVRTVSVTAGIESITMNLLYWAGPKGTRPPQAY